MKKLVFTLITMGTLFALSSCGSDDKTDHGSVSLEPNKLSLTYDQSQELKVVISTNGLASVKEYDWASSDATVATVKTNALTSKAIITAHKIGETTISYTAKDRTIAAACDITVTARENLLNGVYFVKDATVATVATKVPAGATLDTENSTDNLKIYNVANTLGFNKMIYQFTGGKLVATIVAIEANGSVTVEGAAIKALNYIEERYSQIQSGSGDGVTYFDASGDEYTATKAGIVPIGSNLAQQLKIPAGVKYISK